MVIVGFEVLTAVVIRVSSTGYEELYLLRYNAVYSSSVRS
jgi:hypothetical protein